MYIIITKYLLGEPGVPPIVLRTIRLRSQSDLRPHTPSHPSGNSNSLPFPMIRFLDQNCYNFSGFPMDNVEYLHAKNSQGLFFFCGKRTAHQFTLSVIRFSNHNVFALK